MKIPSISEINRDPTLASLAVALHMPHEKRGHPSAHVVQSQRPLEEEVDAAALADPYLAPILKAAWAAGRGCILPDLINLFYAAKDGLRLARQQDNERSGT